MRTRTKKLREESRKKIIRNRVKTTCSQTSFGEHNYASQTRIQTVIQNIIYRRTCIT